MKWNLKESIFIVTFLLQRESSAAPAGCGSVRFSRINERAVRKDMTRKSYEIAVKRFMDDGNLTVANFAEPESLDVQLVEMRKPLSVFLLYAPVTLESKKRMQTRLCFLECNARVFVDFSICLRISGELRVLLPRIGESRLPVLSFPA